MMIAIYIVLALVIIFFVLSMMGPREYSVERSISIARPPSKVYDYARMLKNQDDWGPWAGMDPNMEQTFSGTDGEVGFISRWKGNKKVGEGEQEITKLVKNEVIGTQIRFIKPFKSQSDVELRLKERDNGETLVTWQMHGDFNSPLYRIFGLFSNMDNAIGKDFEKGLSDLKDILEDGDGMRDA